MVVRRQNNGTITNVAVMISILVKRNNYVRPIVTYGDDSRKKTDENKLFVFERKFFGPVKDIETNEWRIRKNEKL